MLSLQVVRIPRKMLIVRTWMANENIRRNCWLLLAIIALILFLSVIESDIALIAACLPTLRFLFGQVGLENIVHSIRSVFSLSSRRSTKSHDETTKERDFERNSSSSQRHLARLAGDSTLETNATRYDLDMEMQPTDKAPRGQIVVRNSVSQEEKRL